MLSAYQAVVREYKGAAESLGKLTYATPDEELLTYELLEFRLLQLRRMSSEADEQRTLRLLNDRYLERRTYLLGERLTAVDLLLYEDLGGYVTKRWTLHEKERFAHVCRWFAHVQSLLARVPGAPVFYDSVYFQRMPLYS